MKMTHIQRVRPLFGQALDRTRKGAGRFAILIAMTLFASLSFGQEKSQDSAAETETSKRLKQTIAHLTEKIGERNLSKPKKLDETVTFVQQSFESKGYIIERQTFSVSGVECHNLIAEVVGSVSPKEVVLIGAHYDSARGTPGANDNGTGLAALMEIAGQLRGKKFSRTLRFVAFANEEPPYFQRDGLMGSWVHAKACRARGDDLKVVMSLETMGYFTDEPQSQKYPPLLAALYPSTGNFIGFVSNLESRPLLIDCVKNFREHCKVDSQLAALPSELKGVGWSDHWSFWQEGYAGIMVTDTAPFRYPHYHEPTDTLDKIDFVRYSQVVDGLTKTIVDLATEK